MLRCGGVARRLALAALLVAAVVAAGCLYTRDRTIKMRGNQLTAEALGSLQKGVTTSADVEKLFGPPDRMMTPEQGREVLLYSYESQETSNTTVLVLYRSGSSLTHSTLYRFEFKDGLLTGYTVQSSK